MSKKKKLIPELRFPQFVKEGEWEYLNGNELFEPISNRNHNSDLPILAVTQEQGAIPRELIDYHVSVSDKSIESYKVVEVGDFIISLRSFQGGIEYSNYLGLCSPAYIVLRKKLDVPNDFYRHYFKSFPFIQDLNKNLEGIRDGKMISYKQFSDILIPKPKKQEQQKIASCLSSLDELITAHSDKLETLAAYKKGLMQNLFPQEGQKVPNYRFPEFEKDGKWIKASLGDYYKNLSTGMTPSRQKPEYFNGKIPWITSGELNYNTITKTREYITEEAVKDTNLRIYPPGTLFIAITGLEAPGTRGKCGLNGVEATTNQSCMAFKENSVIDTLFLFHWYMNFSEELYRYSQGTKQQSFNNSIVERFEIVHPSKKEQRKIAFCLSAVDELITAQAEKIEQLQQHKRGLMQGLFPKIEN
ncbi:restriction endonuclease subunit S [Fulvivirgaceae bacterium BMA10]|uniref:Restriction endonuclease subunit S n=1 Tax=Splendidivirga corallicola TaxID=3051826 RepID=A0ABT8KKG8_9BACT|nr:restriction endonuclease subunit S [Fulvivirgaceae bacterium BMA10]